MEKTTSSGVGTTTVLFLVFLILKLTGNIDWSCWWVFSPFWIPILLLIAIGIIFFLVLLIAIIFGYDINKLKNKLKQ